MHTALLISEIVELICLHLGPITPSWRTGLEKRDLANLARTSTLFLHHALDVLWESQDGLANILRCMPDNLWDGPVRAGSLNTLNATRPITAADWERPVFYLSRVRGFNGGRPRNMASPKLFTELCSSLPTTHWFPNLRYLQWSCYEPFLLLGIRTMTAPHMAGFKLINAGNGGDLSAVTMGLGASVRLLTNVFIECGSRGMDEFRTRISPLILLLARLQRLHIHDLDQTAFNHLAMLPSLNSLKITHLGEIEPFIASHQLHETPPFSGLKELEITTRTVQTALAVITSVAGPLASVDVRIKDWKHKTPMAEVSRMFATLRSTTLQLRSLSLAIEPDTPSYHQTLNDALGHLFSLRNLEELSLQVGEGWDLDNMLVLDMACAWPNIKKLYMGPDPPTHDIRRVTLTGLRAFALHCPKLSHLGLNIDARVPLEELPTTEDSVQRTLTALHVGYSPISDSSAVARLLFAMYPQLSDIEAEERATPDWQSSSIRDDTDEGADVYKLSRTFYERWEGVQHELREKRREESELALEEQIDLFSI
ncbi:hypothetical protein B0H19DRAFT_1138852 [Mycena capillaripes]|nr:hypothetical protein B0H19DRAFT_1138852 [Mycena capillaripes]